MFGVNINIIVNQIAIWHYFCWFSHIGSHLFVLNGEWHFIVSLGQELLEVFRKQILWLLFEIIHLASG